jgi:hypothetical protein
MNSRLADFIQSSKQTTGSSSTELAKPEPTANKLSQFLGSVRRASSVRRSSFVIKESPASGAIPTTPPPPAVVKPDTSLVTNVQDLWQRKAPKSHNAFRFAEKATQWQQQGVLSEALQDLTEFEAAANKPLSTFTLELASAVCFLETDLEELKESVEQQLVQVAARQAQAEEQIRTMSIELAELKRTQTVKSPASPKTHPESGRPPLRVMALSKPKKPPVALVLTNQYALPKNLSNITTLEIERALRAVDEELASRGGFEGEVYTFQRKRDGRMLNPDAKFVGGKIAALFEFKSEKERKVKTFMIAKDCRGTSEPVEDVTSRYRDQSKYILAFDEENDSVIVGCYRE